MRAILFRGKRKDNGEWVYGGVLQTDKWTDIPIVKDYEGNINEPPSYYVESHEVIAESVGQYTGLTDKNGKKIFEGDIVTAEGTAIGSPFFDDMVGKIVYEECAFFIEPKNPEESIYLFTDECADIEVIGNIHDNPELLKEG